MRRGAFEASRGCFDAAEHLARKGNDTLGVAYSVNFRAELAVAEGDVGSALALVDEVARVLGGAEAAFGILEFAHIRATVALAAGHLAEAEGMIEALLVRARRDGYKKVERETERLAEQLARLRRGEEAVQVVHEPVVSANPPELSIQCFGGLRVLRQDGEITDREWRTSRSKLLLVYLLFNGEGATKARLLETVFTDEEISNDLMNMTLVRLRKALEPALERGEPSRYVLRLDGRYSFNHQARIQLDTQEFEHLPRAATLAGGETERVLLERALALYKGEFLPEFDVPWVATLRQRFEALALEICRRLLAIYDAQEPALSIGLLQRALEIDPLCEAFNRELIKRFLETDQHQQALRHYHLCELHYRERLRSAPPADLEELLSRG
jgi:two-component SAPR family response regulator